MHALLSGLLFFAFQNASFEVATVKLSQAPGGVHGGCHGVDSVYRPNSPDAPPPLGRCVIGDARLSHLISIAFGMPFKGGPSWVTEGDVRFNIEGKAEDPSHTTEEQLREMLRALLIERFQMKIHREPVERAGFALIIAKSGSKLQPTKSDEPSLSFRSTQKNGEVQTGKPMRGLPTTMSARAVTIPQLVNVLSGVSGTAVIDATGLTGAYDFTLTWDDEAGPSLSTAVGDLGLRLEPRKVSIEYIVIDSAQKPSGN